MKICCFGASVTQQSFNHKTHEVLGYAVVLEDILKTKIPGLEFEVVAAGSSCFDTAGYCLLPEILRRIPDILVLEWHATGQKKFDDQLWSSAIKLIEEAGITTVIAIFPKKSFYCAGAFPEAVNQARSVASGNIHIFDMYSGYVSFFDPSIHLRDDSHTTSAGAILYGELLADFVCKILPQKKYSCMTLDSRREHVYEAISHLKPNVGFLRVS